MANEDYKSDQIVEIVREFDNTGNKYEVNGLELNKMIPFWRKDKGKFYALAKGQYKYQEESSNTYLVIQDETILGQATEFQLVYIYSQDSSKYIEDFPDLAILVDKYNQLVDDTTKLFTYLKNTGIKADTLKMTKVLVQLEPFTVLYMNDSGELEALPVSEMYSKFDSMVNKAYEEVKSLLLTDKNSMSQELRKETDGLLGELNTLKNKLATALETLTEECKKAITKHKDDVVIPSIDDYVIDTSKPSIDRHVDDKKIELNKFIEDNKSKLKGDKGDTGERGEQGPVGPKGDSIKGDKGDKGDTGENGISIKSVSFVETTTTGNKYNVNLDNRNVAGTFIALKGDKGNKGDKGDQGNTGITAPIQGQYALEVEPNGDLYVVYPDETTPPTFTLESNGDLFLEID